MDGHSNQENGGVSQISEGNREIDEYFSFFSHLTIVIDLGTYLDTKFLTKM